MFKFCYLVRYSPLRWAVLLPTMCMAVIGQAAELTPTHMPQPAGDLAPALTKSPQDNGGMKRKSMTIEHAIQLAKADLSGRLAHSNFIVSGATKVTWRDSSAGCPAPGYSYLQSLTPGYLIVLAAGENIFRYTGSTRSAPRLCQDSTFQAPLQDHPDA
jgi:hypothetical protein